jgi:bacillolysin
MIIGLRRRLPLVALIGVVMGALLLAAGASSPTEAQQQAPGSSQQLSQLNSEGARVHRHQETGEVRFIGASKNNPIDRPAALPENASPEAAARAHMDEHGQLFGIENQASELRAESTDELDDGRASTHFQQVHEGVPILGGELNTQVDEANNLLVATGEVLPEIFLDTEPGVEAKEAQQAALEKIAKDRELEVGGVEATEPELWIYDPSLLGGPEPDVTRLVWRMEVTPAEGIVDFRELVLVDAQSGAVVLNFDQIHNARNRSTYTANNDTNTTLPGTLKCNESSLCTNASLDADVRTAHRYTGETYDFYSAHHGRDSLDNLGMNLISTADYCDPDEDCPWENARWNGQQMLYGDGWATDDIVGHELTHGVTQNESHLFYYYQSGAINESLSDLWGEFIDLSNATEPVDTQWLIGEDIPGRDALRDMQDPPAFGDPDRMTSANYTADTDEGDAGGVHTNSGVGNKAAYLMTDGGTFNGKTITALGITKVAKIYYEAQANLLTSASDYQDLHANLQQACTNLIGTSGITSVDCAEVKDAVDATEMHLIPTAAPNPEAPVCPTGQTASYLFRDNLENTTSGNWTMSDTAWDYDSSYATSGTTHLWGASQGIPSQHAIAKATGVPILTGKKTYLRFNHAYGFEDGYDESGNYHTYDGGVLEYSANGSTWQDAGSLITDNGYSGTIDSGSGNPLGGRPGFVGESNGYISSRVDLSSLAGPSVRFRFRIGEDQNGGDYGWFVDDVRVYTCLQTPSVFGPNQDWTGGPYYGTRGTFFADVTGDGKADATVVNDNTVTVRRSTGAAFGPVREDWTHGAYYGTRGTYFADVTGDEKADAIVVNDNNVVVRRSTGSGFKPNEYWTSDPFYGILYSSDDWPPVARNATYFADVTGDGKADAIAVGHDSVFVRPSTGSGFGPSQDWTRGAYYGYHGTYFADVTGDGKADAIVVNDNNVVVRRSTGSGFGQNEYWTSNPYYGTRGTYFADVTGGGWADAIVVNDNNVVVRRSM